MLALRDGGVSDAIGGRRSMTGRRRSTQPSAHVRPCRTRRAVVDGSGSVEDVHRRILAEIPRGSVDPSAPARPRDAWREWRKAAGRGTHAPCLAAGRATRRGQDALCRRRPRTGRCAPADAQNHPDITLTYGARTTRKNASAPTASHTRSRAASVIAQVRGMQARLDAPTPPGDKRAIIIDPADDLERNAANALLKSLEEPPIGTDFLLVAHQSGPPAADHPLALPRARFPRIRCRDGPAAGRSCAGGMRMTNARRRLRRNGGFEGMPPRAGQFVDRELGKVRQAMDAILARGDPDFQLRGTLAGLIGSRPDRERIRAPCSNWPARQWRNGSTGRWPRSATRHRHA